MASAIPHDELEVITRAFSGLGGFGVDESSLVSTIAKWRGQAEKKSHFRKSFSRFFSHGQHAGIELCQDDYVQYLKTEFSRFKNIITLWAMNPWDRDARWIHHVIQKAHPSVVIIEIACTRSSDDLLGVRKAYHARYHSSIEEDIAYHIKDEYSRLLVGLVSSYRYEGPRVNEELAKAEAKVIGNALKNAGQKKLLENEDVIRILTTRSKKHLAVTFKSYNELFGKSLEGDLGNEVIQEVVQCLVSPAKYFSKVIDKSFKEGADKNAKDALTRVMVSRADHDMEEIKAAYSDQYGAKLEDTIAKNTHGNYKDALLSLAGSGN